MEDREAVTPGKKFPRRKVEKYFQKLQKNGTELYVDGEKVSPSQAAAYAVREESPYMADYILGEQGKISKDRKSTRLNSSHNNQSRMPSSA